MIDIQKLMNAALKYLEKRIAMASDKIVAAIKASEKKDDGGVQKAINTQTATLKDVLGRQTSALEKVANPKFEVKVDRTPIKVEAPDFTQMEKMMVLMLNALEAMKPADYTESFDAFGKAILEAKPKDQVSINPKQIEGLMMAITNSGGVKEAPNGGLYSGRKVVTTAGTAVQLQTTKERCENITITAESDNSGLIAVGDSSVVAAEGTQQGAILTPLGSITVKVGDLSKIYIDSTVNGDGCTFAYER